MIERIDVNFFQIFSRIFYFVCMICAQKAHVHRICSLLSRFYGIYILIFDRLFILCVVSVRFDPLGSLELLSVRSDLLLNQSNTSDLISIVCLRFYRPI
jgi:hypothetical protein